MRIRYLVIVMAAMFVASGCSAGGGKDIKSVEKCLKGIKGMTVETMKSGDPDTKDMKAGVSGMMASDPTKLVVAAAMEGKTDKAVKDGLKKIDTEAKSAGDKVKVQKGSSGKYVWFVMSSGSSKDLDAATSCVKP